MSETCIVCLGDLGENASVLPLPDDQRSASDETKLEVAEDDEAGDARSPVLSPGQTLKRSLPEDEELIAHLLPCGHHLHDECLKPWVERANSCPICRQKFNQVELLKTVGGAVLSSYGVEDRTQVAEIDPSMLFEDEEEAEFGPCHICGSDEDEEVLLICDGCNHPHHTYCVGLSEVPSGSWYCEECALPRAVELSLGEAQPQSSSSAGYRTRGQLRRRRNNALSRSSDWARIWETVFDRTALDLDFPFHNSTQIFRAPRPHHARDRRAWERRLEVAEQQGGAEQFRRTAPLFDAPTVSRPKPEPEEPESIEEVIAWNAMEKARDIDHDPVGRSRKRKSVTNSPAEADGNLRKRRRTHSVPSSPSSPKPPPEAIQRKRPRTRRANEIIEAGSDGGESASSRRPSHYNITAASIGNGHSFLQSLLKEVESSTPADEIPRGRPRLSLQPGLDHPSPQGSSPEASPTSSNLPSPRALSATPPPVASRTRPGSPSLTSRVEPIYPLLGSDMSPASPEVLAQRPKLKPKSRSEVDSRTRQWVQTGASSPIREGDLSPTRASMSLPAKERVQKLVKEALKEPYSLKKITSDQYTDINRAVSRMLYDKVGEEGDVDGSQGSEWRRLANEEVIKAVDALSAQAMTS